MNRTHTTEFLNRALLLLVFAAPVSFADPAIAESAADAEAGLQSAGSINERIDQIEALRAEAGEFSEALVMPLIDLARTQLDAGDSEAAEDTLLRAQHLIHRNEGVHALTQLEVVELMTDLYLDREEPHDADRQQQLAVYLAERNFGKDSPDIVPALMKLEAWYADTGQFRQAQRTLDRVMEIIRADGGDADPRLIEPLIESARIRRLHRACCSYRLLEEARIIVEANPGLPADERATVYAALGDAYLASNRDDRAAEAYRLGWDTLDTDLAENQFGEPVQIAIAEDLESHDRVNKRVFSVDRDPIGFTRYRELSVEERLGIETSPPQQFFVPLTDSGRDFHIRERYSDDTLDKTSKLVGQPFQFILPQLQQIMPLSADSEEQLARIEVGLEFTVQADGRVSDVEISGDVPPKLKRLMRRVLYKAHFRPRLVDGVPVSTENYRLVQTFH